MGKMTVPSSSAMSSVEIESFLGADLTNEPGYISMNRSPDCPNVIRESVGKIRKWIGYETVKQYFGAINGCHTFYSEYGDKVLYHAGTQLFDGDICVYSGMADEKSVSRQLNGNLYILDGFKMLVFRKKDGADAAAFESSSGTDSKEIGITIGEAIPEDYPYECVPAESIAYIPIIFISKDPQGGGTPYEPINLLQPKKTESFLGNATDKVYQLAATELNSVDSVVQVTADGEKTLTENTDYTVDLDLGTVTFNEVKKPVVSGEDNIKITYSKHIEGYSERINKCDICTLYGVNGARDRLFVAGNNGFGNRDYYSQMDSGLYFGDLWYTVVGADNSKIMGYTIINDNLATHLNRSDDDTNIILRSGTVIDGEPSFTLCGSYQGTGAICKHSFGVLETEPLFLTADGIFAVTPSDVLGERFAQLRSFYLNGLLLKQDLKNAYACVYDRFYMLACGEYIFALDGTQTSREKTEPYSNRQYAGFYRTNVNARCMWIENDRLYFGTSDGKIKAFRTDWISPESYNDDGNAIECKWTTPYILGKRFYAKKQFKKVHALLASSYETSLDVYANYDGKTETITEDSGSFLVSTFFWRVNFKKITFNCDTTPKTVSEKINIKPDNKKVQFIFSNKGVNESWGLYNVAIQFIEKT